MSTSPPTNSPPGSSRKSTSITRTSAPLPHSKPLRPKQKGARLATRTRIPNIAMILFLQQRLSETAQHFALFLRGSVDGFEIRPVKQALTPRDCGVRDHFKNTACSDLNEAGELVSGCSRTPFGNIGGD